MSTDRQAKLDETQTRPFAAVLQELHKGNVHAELSQLLHELVAAVRDTGKKGTLTVKLDVKPIKPGQVDTLEVTATVTANPPRVDTPTTVFFTDQTGNLTREDPDRANQLPLREIVGGRQEGAA
jgi:hypothetical protein